MVNGEPFSSRQSITASFSAPTINKLNPIQTRRFPTIIIEQNIENTTFIEQNIENTTFIEL